jgi:dynein heavy chain
MDIGKLRKHLNDCLEKYNNSPGVVRMDLVLFRDAIEHSKIYFSHPFDKVVQ